MAEVGKGDPRWIVSQRDDGKNVNSWHWEEKDLSAATHAALKEAFKGKTCPSDNGVTSFTFSELSDVSGDVTVAQRKGKIMCYFEVKMTVKWEAMVGDTKITGKLDCPEVEHDNFTEDFPIKVSTVERSAEANKAEAVAQKAGRKLFRDLTKEHFDALFKQYNVGTKVPTGPTPAGGGSASPNTTTTTAAAASPKPKPATPVASSTEATSINWVIDWSVPAAELYRTFTDEGRASAFTRCPATIDAQPEGTFQYLNGAITGYFNSLEEGKNITMQWRLGSWPANHHSSVVMEFVTEEHGRTRLNFAQAGIPAGEVDRVKQGWSINFFEPIKMMMGYSFTWVKS